MSIYLSLLPTDLLISLFLYFTSHELLGILHELKDIPKINRVIYSDIFWNKIWRRDISSFVSLPQNPYEKYKEIFNKLSKIYHSDKIIYLAGNGYDILLLHVLLDRYDYNQAMIYAAYGGHIEIIELMVGLGANYYNFAMKNAAEKGHIEIVKLMLDLGATDYNWAMGAAAREGHIDIVRLMMGLGANNYNFAMLEAVIAGHIDIVKLMLDAGADNYDWSIQNTKNIEIKNLIRSYQNR